MSQPPQPSLMSTLNQQPTQSAAQFAQALRWPLIIKLLISLHVGVGDFLLPLYVQALGGSPQVIGNLVGLGAAFGVLARLSLSWLADRGIIRLLLRISLLALASGFAIWSFADSSTWLLPGQALLAMGRAGSTICLSLLIAQLTSPGQRGSGYGRLTMASSIATIIGSIIVGIGFIGWDLETRQQLQQFSWLNSIVSQLPTPIPRTALFHGIYSVFSSSVVLAGIFSLRSWPHALVAKRGTIETPWRSVLRQPSIRNLLLAQSCISAAYSASIPMTVPLLTNRFGASVAAVAVAYIVPGIIYALFPARLGRIADQIGYRRAATLGLGVSMLVYLALPISPQLAITAILWACEALAWSCYVPALEALLAESVISQQRGTALAIYGIAGALTATVAAPLGASLFSRLPAAPFLFSALCLGMAAMIAARTPPTNADYATIKQ
ncbi:MFS transporter [Herpetosiphon llansteffanensis]|uniref:MFS transporter n=1 Tax=Herpetosiphon llansteffanensis TaxID=2094568 RepID=UPI000D7CDE8B|nr:MFS transporter [Herpetosiphon llansteffanensis]